ncbi:MAG: hypothetical protein J7L34_04355, partial [Thermotogaceae bacterium]|nr:hypothetical protein [Thermotogaceae bacterium]
AKQIIEEAEKKAEKITLKAEEEAKKLLEENRLAYKKEIEATKAERERLKSIASSLSSLFEAEIRRLSEMMLPIVKVMLKKILEKESDEELILRRIQSVLSKIYDTSTIILKINPADLKIVEHVKDSLPSNIEIQPDPSIEPGGVIVESHLGIMDKTTSFQWKIVEDIIDEIL